LSEGLATPRMVYQTVCVTTMAGYPYIVEVRTVWEALRVVAGLADIPPPEIRLISWEGRVLEWGEIPP
jgi:hypothetical protein